MPGTTSKLTLEGLTLERLLHRHLSASLTERAHTFAFAGLVLFRDGQDDLFDRWLSAQAAAFNKSPEAFEGAREAFWAAIEYRVSR